MATYVTHVTPVTHVTRVDMRATGGSAVPLAQRCDWEPPTREPGLHTSHPVPSGRTAGATAKVQTGVCGV